MLNKQIAGELGIAEKTIKVHRARVMDKMRAGSVADLVRLAEKLGLRGHQAMNGRSGRTPIRPRPNVPTCQVGVASLCGWKAPWHSTVGSKGSI